MGPRSFSGLQVRSKRRSRSFTSIEAEIRPLATPSTSRTGSMEISQSGKFFRSRNSPGVPSRSIWFGLRHMPLRGISTAFGGTTAGHQKEAPLAKSLGAGGSPSLASPPLPAASSQWLCRYLDLELGASDDGVGCTPGEQLRCSLRYWDRHHIGLEGVQPWLSRSKLAWDIVQVWMRSAQRLLSGSWEARSSSKGRTDAQMRRGKILKDVSCTAPEEQAQPCASCGQVRVARKPDDLP
jgi:hypothetical protein